jgi:hypothetical protein
MRAGTRWLSRWFDQADGPPIDEVAIVAAALAALGCAGHKAALESLRAVTTAARCRGWVACGLNRTRNPAWTTCPTVPGWTVHASELDGACVGTASDVAPGDA